MQYQNRENRRPFMENKVEILHEEGAKEWVSKFRVDEKVIHANRTLWGSVAK